MSATVTIRNDSPQGCLDVPLLGRDVEAGEEVTIPIALAERLLPQAIWTAIDAGAIALEAELAKRDDQFTPLLTGFGPPSSDAASKGKWAAYAAHLGIDTDGKTKTELIAAVTELQSAQGADPAQPNTEE
ncbi:MAG TPA: hypothetical protein VGK41_04875 [Solirubrobacterales bacterium]